MKSSLLSKRLISFCLLSSLLFSTRVYPQVFQQWARLYDDPPNSPNYPAAIVADNLGNAYVTGTSLGTSTGYDIVTIKYNTSGAEEWVARYDGFNGSDNAVAITLDKTGNLYVTGYGEGNGTSYDIITIKYNSAGVQQWVARFNGPDNGSDRSFAIKVDESSNVYVSGYVSSQYRTPDYAVIKYNSLGVQQWVKYYNGPGDGVDVPFGLAVDPTTSDVYVTGFTTESITGSDYTTIKYNSAGIQQWVRKYIGPYLDEAWNIGLDAQGNVYVTGHSVSLANIFGCVTIKYSRSGAVQWTARYDGPENLYFQQNGFGVDSAGNVYITGYTPVSIAGTNPKQYKTVCATIKYNSEGVQL